MINQSDAVGVKRLTRMIATAVIAFVLAIVVFASTAFAGLLGEYNVDIKENGQTITITTDETEPIDILSKANITLSNNDKLDITGFEAGKGGTIVIDRQNTMNVEMNGAISTYQVYADTVGAALKEAGVAFGAKDQINYALTAAVEDGMVVHINRTFTVTLGADGKKTQFTVTNSTVADLLALAKITLGGDDYTEPSLDTALKAGMQVNVYRVAYKSVTEQKALDYKTTKKKDATLSEGKTKVTTKGVKGAANVTYQVKYVNGKEASRTELSRKTTKKPVNQVIRVGTKKVKKSVALNGVKSKNGYSVGQVISGRYTHYCACATCNGNGRGITSSGRRIYNGMANPYYVACNWLPLGSVIEVSGKTYTVVDRGGSGLSRQGRIDIFTPEGHSACYRYGTGSCSIKIVRLGW